MQTEKQIPEDEIDLRSIGHKISSLIAYPFSLFLSNRLITFCFIVVAILLPAILKQGMTKTYTSSFIIHPLDRHEKVHLRMLSDIQTLLKYKDYSSIAKELKMDSVISRKIIALETSNPSLKNPVDSANNTEVIITTADYNQFIPIQNALLNYLEGNAYFSKIKILQTKQIDIELAQVEKDIVQLDSLKLLQLRTYGKQAVSSQNSLVLSELVDPTTTYVIQTDRINKKSSLLARSNFLDNFQLVKSCVVIRQYTSPPRILVMCLYTIPVFLFLCFLFLHFRMQRQKRKNKLEAAQL